MLILEPVACDYSRQFMITSIFIRDPWHVNVKMPYKIIKIKKKKLESVFVN
jgi:hypothetical protein